MHNRVTHSTTGRNSKDGRNAKRYMSLVSIIKTIDIVGDVHTLIKMQGELIDCERSEFIKERIEK